jgi:hypothetical protein
MFVCVYSAFVQSCVGAEALGRADPPSEEPYPLCKNQETEKAAKFQQKAVDGWMDGWMDSRHIRITVKSNKIAFTLLKNLSASNVRVSYNAYM